MEDSPRVRWISRNGGSRFEDELAHAAASYDADVDMLIINADWRGYLELRHEVGRAISNATLVATDEAWTIAHDEWAQALSSTVIACQNIATEDSSADRLAEYLSDGALTASVANRRYIYLRCRTKVIKLEWDRRKAAHPLSIEDLGGA
ncbi:MAG: hypothetical protein QOD83_2145 [Solirubrobacteraceae bacterium]|nr:hypothetical protein [Solirubrobacteraceae bacterium]